MKNSSGLKLFYEPTFPLGRLRCPRESLNVPTLSRLEQSWEMSITKYKLARNNGRGKSTHPRQIPNSPYWVMTNADTDQKKEMLSRALTVLGYDQDVVQRAASLL